MLFCCFYCFFSFFLIPPQDCFFPTKNNPCAKLLQKIDICKRIGRKIHFFLHISSKICIFAAWNEWSLISSVAIILRKKSTAKAVVGLLSCRCRPKVIAWWSRDDPVMVAWWSRRQPESQAETSPLLFGAGMFWTRWTRTTSLTRN